MQRGETLGQNIDGGSKKIKQKAARVSLIRQHKSSTTQELPAGLYAQKLSFSKQTFPFAILIYGATI